ncbi:MAG: hypothetical protein HUU08_09425 [Candidatus Brocadia sp.]|nr:hypothetical protein [Candidatus Brocadia sp.]UJS17504.1 MAG: hypothetical protein L3J17_00185 [Candidatus Jettenia sp.]
MPTKKKVEPRLKLISLILKDSLERAGIDLPNSVAISTAGEIMQGVDLGDCREGCKEGCKDGCKDGCQNSSKTS